MIFDMVGLKRKAIAAYPFFGSIAANMEYVETDETERLANDEAHLFYNPGYLSGLSDSSQVFVLARELCHIAFGHKMRGKGKDPIIWERAADAVVNQMLKRDGLLIPAGEIDYPEAIDYDAEQYYEILLKEKMAIDLITGNPQGRENPEGGENEGEGVPLDGEDASEEEQGEEPGEEILPEGDAGDGGGEEAGEERDKEPEEDSGDEYALVGKKQSKEGNAENREERIMEKIGTSPPLIDWRMILQETLNYDVDWSYRNAVLENGIVVPVLEDRPVPETEIVLDTSWSVDEELLRSFLRECKSILTFSKLKAGCFDTEFYGFHDIKTQEDIDNMPFPGGGGTDFNTAADAFTHRVDNRIIFTDGQAPVPEKYLNAVWVVYGEEEIQPPGGRVIYRKPEQFKRTNL